MWRYYERSGAFCSFAMIDGQYRDLVTHNAAADVLYELIRDKDSSSAAHVYEVLNTIFSQAHQPIEDIALCVDSVGEYYITKENSLVGPVYTLVIEKLFTGHGQIINYTPGKDLHLIVQADTSGGSPVYSILEDTIDIEWYLPN